MESPGRTVSAIVLAAGQGTRMRSQRPKPLHVVGGRPMVRHVVDALGDVAPRRIVVVVGHGADAMCAQLAGTAGGVELEFAEQTVQRGTGDAVGVGLAALSAGSDAADAATDVLVLPGDAPLLRAKTVAELVATHRASSAAATVLTARLGDPTGYGRIVRDADGGVTGVVEQVDAIEEQRRIDEVNTSMYCFRAGLLTEALGRIRPDNAQGEWYLTDVIGLLHADGHRVTAHVLDDPAEAQGVNDRVQLAAAEAALRVRINDEWMRAGVSFVDPVTTWVEPGVTLARDVTLWPGVVLRGVTVVGTGAEIGAHAQVTDAEIGAGAVIGASAVVESGVVVEADTRIPALTRLVAEPDDGSR